jgi:hypothetical protein
MPHIVLTEEQTRVLEQASGPVDVRDHQGRLVGSLKRLEAADVEAIEHWKRTRGLPSGRSIPSAEVQAHLRRLEEIRQTEGLDEQKMRELLRRMQAGEQV